MEEKYLTLRWIDTNGVVRHLTLTTESPWEKIDNLISTMRAAGISTDRIP